jgi:hypothetical protein
MPKSAIEFDESAPLLTLMSAAGLEAAKRADREGGLWVRIRQVAGALQPRGHNWSSGGIWRTRRGQIRCNFPKLPSKYLKDWGE